MQILDLRTRPQYIPTLAAWHHEQWAYLNPGETLQSRIANMQEYLGDELIPSTFVAVDDELLGSASIIAHDMDARTDLTPWLASVFVAPAHRGKSIGRKLVQHVMQQAQQAGIRTLYLFTPDQMAFYRSLGWQVLSIEDYRGHPVTIMSVQFGNR